MTSPEKENRDDRWFALHSKVQEEKIKKAFEIFRSHGIEPILIKGWAAAIVYPEKSERIFADIDLCVEPTLFQKAEKLLETEEVRKINVDLHRGLRHLDTVSWADLFENSRLVELSDSKIRVLRAEDHLRVLCVHWLVDGGAYKEKLWDIFYAVKNRPEDFDWERCLAVVSKKRRKWIVSTIGLAQKYLGLSLEDTPIEREAAELPKWLTAAVEKEWKSDVRIKPLQTCLGDRKEFWRQIRKRFPPNPVQATVDLEGSFDKTPRIFYQIGDIFFRISPSIKRIKSAFFRQKNL